ncbi:protein CDV3 homolog [Rhinoderma darwinii]|uniref:protein CDV3 homolog n=1 Tax=Rhinoderma darwinii TaxID=43563 RepID=UPI003F660DAF
MNELTMVCSRVWAALPASPIHPVSWCDRCVQCPPSQSHFLPRVPGVANMAEPEERSLDDFFAKRDKKKKKEKGGSGGPAGGKGAAKTADGTQSTLTSLSGAVKSSRKEKSYKSEAQDTHQEKEDDEWKEFEQKEVDYSGLRLHSLQISNEKEDDDYEKKDEQGGDWEEAGGCGSEKTVGPWNKSAPAQAPISVVQDEPEPAQPSGVYRPPAARMSAAPRKPQGPPEIFSDTQFPSLQATAKHIESRRDKEMEKTFEIVKHKNRAREEAAKNQALQLQLDNQYAVLGEQ